MTRPIAKPTNQGSEGVAAPVSALVERMPPDLVQSRANPARAVVPGCFAIRGR